MATLNLVRDLKSYIPELGYLRYLTKQRGLKSFHLNLRLWSFLQLILMRDVDLLAISETHIQRWTNQIKFYLHDYSLHESIVYNTTRNPCEPKQTQNPKKIMFKEFFALKLNKIPKWATKYIQISDSEFYYPKEQELHGREKS